MTLLTLLPPSPGPAYFVSPTGNDSNDGRSPDRAWRTCAKVNATAFAPGDWVLFECGGRWTEILQPTVSGSSGQYLSFGAYGSGPRPVIDGSDDGVTRVRAACFAGSGLDLIRLRGLELRNATESCFAVTTGTHRVENCVLDRSGDQNAQNEGDSTVTYVDTAFLNAVDDGISIHTTATVIVLRGYFRGNGQGINSSGTDMRCTVRDSVFDGNGTNDILTDANTALVVERTIFRNMPASGTFTSLQGRGTIDSCVIDASGALQTRNQVRATIAGQTLTLRNCTLVSSAATNKGNADVGATGTLVFINCAFARWWRACSITAGGVATADHCDFFGLTTKTFTANTNELTTDPLLVNPAAGDYRVQAASPLRGAGVAIPGLTLDLLGQPFASPPSIGAVEYYA